MSKYIISFVAILSAFFFVFSTRTDLLTGAANENRLYEEYLSSAVTDASDAMKETMKGNSAVPERDDRKTVEDRFFKTLAINMGYQTDDELDRLHVMVPAVVIIDNDGYYVSYNRKSESGSKIERIETDIIPWSVNTGSGYLVRYSLNNNITVTDLASGKDYSGNYLDVADALPDDAMTGLHEYGITRRKDHVSDGGTITENSESADTTADNDSYFAEKRKAVIIPSMEKNISYYISQSNTLEGRNEGYVFSMPETNDTDWQRTLSGPTVMAFMQGMKMNGQNRYLNIYALSGGTISKKSKAGFILTGNTRRFSENADIDGYVPGGKAAALSGAEAVGNSADYVVHHHWGSDTDGTGCYGEPVYHVHTAACYSTIVHRHTDISGNIPNDSEFIYDKAGNRTDIIKTEYGGPGSCYTIPVYHHHTEDCYHDLVHQHIGDPVNGGGCYTTVVYHHHTASCYAEGTDTTVYPETKKIYHTHVQPVFYYKEIGGSKEYSSKEAYRNDGIDDDDVYISRADVSAPKACYDAIYARKAYLVKGTRTLTINAEYSNTGSYVFNAPVSSKYRVSIGNDSFHEDIELNRNDALTVTVGNETNVTKKDGTVVITSGASGKQTVKISLVEDYTEDVNYSDPPLYNIDVTNFDEETGDGKYTGKTNVYSEYEGGKDRIGEWNYDCTAEREKSQDKKITEKAGMSSSTGKNAVNEGYIFTDIELSCGKSCTDVDEEVQTGQPVTVHQKGELICGKTETTVDHYELGCGYIDIHSDGKIMQQYNDLKDNLDALKAAGASNAEINEAAGKLNDMASYILNHSIKGTEITCGYTENEQIGWRLGCGKKDGAVESQTLTCGKTETTIDHYKLNCGLKDGEMIPVDVAAEKNEH